MIRKHMLYSDWLKDLQDGKPAVGVVSHTEEGETIRLISARKASRGERELYEEG